MAMAAAVAAVGMVVPEEAPKVMAAAEVAALPTLGE